MTPTDNTPVQADALVERLNRFAEWAESGEEDCHGYPIFSDDDASIFRQAADLIERLAHQPTTDAEAGYHHEPQGANSHIFDGYLLRGGQCVAFIDADEWNALRSSLAHPPADKARIAELEAALHAIDVEAGNTIPPDGKDAAFAALERITRIINPIRNRPTNQGGEQP